jgi:hypothetical protein
MLLLSQLICACVCIHICVCTWMRGTCFSHLQNFVVWTLDKFFKDYMVILLIVHETHVMTWCARSMLMPWRLLICWSVTQQSHCTIWTTLAHASGSVKLGGQLGCARSSVLLLTSLNLLHQSNTAVSCKWSLYVCFIQELMNAGPAPSAHRNQVTQRSLCLDKSITILHWATHCCAVVTQSGLFMICGYNVQLWPLSNSTRMINITLHITWQYMLSAYLSDDTYRQPILIMGMLSGFYVFRSLGHATMLPVILSSYG